MDLNGRRILKFVVSLGDFGSLHDSRVTNHTLMMLAGAKFNIHEEVNETKRREINLSTAYCQTLHDRYFEYRQVLNNSEADLFDNLAFKNIFFIEYLFEKERSAEKFLSALMRGSRTSFGTRDPFVEHALLSPSFTSA